MDYYKILEIDKNSTMLEIEEAYDPTRFLEFLSGKVFSYNEKGVVKLGMKVLRLITQYLISAKNSPQDIFDILSDLVKHINPYRFTTKMLGIDGFNVLSLDKKILTNIYDIAKEKNIILQGNLDPNILLNGGKELEDEVKKIMLQFSQNDHIFNLSHGILPTTPIDNVKKTLDIIKNFNEAK